ncbi:MAG TPA: leucine-rich repeat domain-containing protein [Bacilli bacterium]|nr:leucine-rich repeat domain-containing protein [Bacilli bacterium]
MFAGEPDVIKQTGEFEFAVNSDGESYYLIKYTGKDRYISIPKTHKGYPVTEIGKEAFKDNTIIETLITNNVKKIEDDAFNGATNLKEVNLTKAESIGTKAFYNCSSLTNVFIPNTVTSIGYSTFDGCSSLKSVIIPNSVTSIGGSLFRDCGILIIYAETSSKLSGWDDNWNISRRFVYWGVKEYDTLNDIDYARLSDGKIIIRGFNPNSLITDFVLPDTINTYQVTAIQSFAFYNCYSLTSVIIPNSVTSIDIGTFMNCSSLTSITIPNSVTSIGNQAFYYCYSLTSVTIPNSVTSIGYYAFRDCSSLTSIIIPNGVTNIGGAIFSGCSSLTSITIPNSVTRIEGYAFDGCSSLTSIFIPNSVTRIENYTFRNCNSLTIYAEASSKPSEWSSDWNCSNRPVYWGAKR